MVAKIMEKSKIQEILKPNIKEDINKTYLKLRHKDPLFEAASSTFSLIADCNLSNQSIYMISEPVKSSSQEITRFVIKRK
ncbi:hypothetical protein HZA98_04550 [Candidatus Woesearchaeota archaeon]|nr:hypothetical protein [Candidatus Woesearchaeota archaeon]